jgi:ribonuclease R
MLPEKLSNGLCSLNPDVERLTLVCDMVITKDGEMHGYQFYPAVIHSAARLTYTEVAAILGIPKDLKRLNVQRLCRTCSTCMKYSRSC